MKASNSLETKSVWLRDFQIMLIYVDALFFQDDKSTPVHFAAAQGNLDMIKLMHELQQDNFTAALYTADAMGMTPLHRAALFNHVPVVTFFLEQVGQ
jgi:hypothetical protein